MEKLDIMTKADVWVLEKLCHQPKPEEQWDSEKKEKLKRQKAFC
jgi:hypothetical protein